MRLKSIFALFIFIFAIFGSINADTIRLTNGYTIYGKVNEYPVDSRLYRITFLNGGSMLIKKTDVKEFEVNDKDQFDGKQKGF